MKLEADWLIDPGTVALCRALQSAGYRAYFVGGCVRNAMLDEPVDDIDISTDARPETVIEIATAADLKPIPTGIDHGTITVIAHGKPLEVTTFRKDVETDGRRAVVAFADSLEEDAMRRDFTMNALYADPDGNLLDPLGQGLKDLNARVFRFIGYPHDRIREDYLRILRFFRFQARYGRPDDGFEAEGLAACAELAGGIETLSRERVGAEMKKLLSASDPVRAIATMEQTGVLARVLHGATAEPLALLVHFEDGLPADPIRRLAALGGETPDAALRLSRSEAKNLAQLRKAAISTASAGELGYRLGLDTARDALLLRAALLETPPGDLDFEMAGSCAEKVLPLQAADFMAKGLQGPEIGAAMRDAEQRWIKSGFVLSREALLE